MQLRPRGGPPKRFGSLAEYPATRNQRRFVPSRDETAAQRPGGRISTMTAPQISAPAFDTDLRQCAAPQPPITSQPRRTGQPRRAREFPARSRFAAPITQGAADDLPKQTGTAAPAGPALTPPPFHCTRPPCGAATPRGKSARGDSAVSPAHAAVRWLEGAGLRRAAHGTARKGCDAPSGPAPARNAACPQGRIGPG